jgi:hypothetical protein
VIEVYAIADHRGPRLPDVAGLREVPVAGLALLCAAAGPDEVSPEALWRHEEVVEALMEDRDLLPVRYGSRFIDEAAAARAVEPRRDDLMAALERVRGAVELSLRVIAVEERAEGGGATAAASGVEYLRDRARLAAAQDSVIQAIHEPLSLLARASVVRRPRDSSERLRSAYLVSRDAVETFAAGVGRLQEASPALRLLCTGPWPPYSFAER